MKITATRILYGSFVLIAVYLVLRSGIIGEVSIVNSVVNAYTNGVRVLQGQDPIKR